MKLIAYVRDGQQISIRPAPVERVWMDRTIDRGAYRCLPLDIANQHGWEILCQFAFNATWNGGNDPESISINSETAAPMAVSHFGFGILTMKLPCIFVTEPQIDLFVQGPINRFKDGIAALSAIVETDWLSTTFTMNWKFIRPNTTISFHREEPFCHIFPIARGSLEAVEPEIHPLSSNPRLEERNRGWRESRDSLLEALHTQPPQDPTNHWQKNYLLGREPDGTPSTATRHRTKLKLRQFELKSGKEVL